MLKEYSTLYLLNPHLLRLADEEIAKTSYRTGLDPPRLMKQEKKQQILGILLWS
jgi:hypothetical protein